MTLRLDYALYALAVVFFIIAAAAFHLLGGFQRNLAVVVTVVLGILAIGIGYSQRPKIKAAAPSPAMPETPMPETATTIQTQQAPEAAKIETPMMETPEQQPTQTATEPAPVMQPEPSTETPPMEAPPMEAPPVTQTPPPEISSSELLKVKGIGEKRATQLKAIGITSIDELANASATEIASKLQVYPKIVEKWIAGAKVLAKQ